MLNAEEYQLAWIGYLCGAGLVAVVIWSRLSWVRPEVLRVFLRLSCVVLVMTPILVKESASVWAHASAVVFFGVVTREPFMPIVGPDYTLGIMGAAALAVLYSAAAWLVRRLLK